MLHSCDQPRESPASTQGMTNATTPHHCGLPRQAQRAARAPASGAAQVWSADVECDGARNCYRERSCSWIASLRRRRPALVSDSRLLCLATFGRGSRLAHR